MRSPRYAAVIITAVLGLTCGAEPATPIVSPSPTAMAETPGVKSDVPQRILDPILKEAASLARVAREKLIIVRAEAVVWNNGSLGCPEPGMEYTQALVNGYWVVINAAAQTYDFRVGRDGSFRLCPAGRGRPPLKSDDR